MQPSKKHINLYLNVSTEGKVRTLYPDMGLFMPIKKLVLPESFTCNLSDILKICDLIKAGENLEPIIITTGNLIADGKKRYYAYKRLGYERVYVIRVLQNVSNNSDEEFEIIKKNLK